MTTPRSRARRSMPVIVTLDGDNTHLANLCGPLDENLRQLADGMNVKLSRRGSRVTIEGELAEQLYLKLGYVRVGEIPNYASFPDGRLWATIIFYKEL